MSVLTRDETGGIAQQEENDARDILRGARAPERRLLGPLLEVDGGADVGQFDTQLTPHGRVDNAGAHAIDRDVRRERDRRTARHADDGSLARGVRGRELVGDLARHRREVDDSARPARLEEGLRVLREQVRAEHVDREGTFPVRHREIEELTCDDDARGVDESVEAL